MRAALPGGAFTVMLLLLLGAQPIATDLYLPALPAITRDLGPASTSLTVFALAFGISQLFSGPLADRWGRRPLLLAGLAFYAVGALGATLAGSIAVLATWRAVQGVAMAVILICARAAVRDRYTAQEGPRVMALGLSGLGVVALLAPLLIGHWIFVIGHGFHQPCSQAGAVSDLPHAAGRAVAWSGFFTMAVAFAMGQTTAHLSHGADGESGLLTGTWPVALPMALAGLGIWFITRYGLPRAQPASRRPRH